MTDKQGLYRKYPMLQTAVGKMSDYISPDDYDRLLKTYSFGGKTDLQMLEDYLRHKFDIQSGTRGSIQSALELGCGTGRATDVTINVTDIGDFTMLDLSPHMLAVSRKKYAQHSNVHFEQSDTIEYLEQCNAQFDLIYSMWSFSHSIHQVLDTHAYLHDIFRVQEAVRRMVRVMMKPGSSFYMMHVDSLSEEQRMLFRQWARAFPMFGDEQHQTPSKLLLDDVLEEMEQRDEIQGLDIQQHTGDRIEYDSIEEALDASLNFHLESFFNDRPEAKIVADDLTAELLKFRQEDGRIVIRPGCITYQFQKAS